MKIDFLGIPVDALTMQDTVKVIDEAIQKGKHINHVVINAGKVVSMQKDKPLFDSVVSCDIINADGQSIVWAARILGKRLPERVAGIDLMEKLLKLAHEKEYGCFFFGAKKEVVKKVSEIVSEQYDPDIVAGYRNGYYIKEEEPVIAKEIADSGAQILFVAITSPQKEKFLHKYRDVLKNINFTMGVGGSFDVIAGVTNRAPSWMQKMGLEWFYRFLQEPLRMWRRYLLGNILFLWIVLKERFSLNKK
ncbi:MAG: WecB/TagA/CpsF family glycosyltransferase [Bacteroidales bacterium]|nr:WecB/TagA/CpsF family glycosyltransferase [Bacteroidales bacterium]